MPWTLSSLLTMSTTRRGISRNSPPTGQNVPPRRKASMHSCINSLAPVYSTAASTPSPPVAARIVSTAVDDDIGAPALEARGLAGVARGGDDGGAGELGKRHGGRAHAARRAGDENGVVHAHVKPGGDDAVSGRARPHGGGTLIEVEIGSHFDPVALRTRHELRIPAEHGVAGKVDAAGEIAQPA